jgi:adenylate cyclase
LPRLAQSFADQLVTLGLPIWRLHVGFSTFHPEVESIGVTWTRDGRREREEYGHGSFEGIAGTSPFYDAVIAAQTRARAADYNAPA